MVTRAVMAAQVAAALAMVAAARLAAAPALARQVKVILAALAGIKTPLMVAAAVAALVHPAVTAAQIRAGMAALAFPRPFQAPLYSTQVAVVAAPIVVPLPLAAMEVAALVLLAGVLALPVQQTEAAVVAALEPAQTVALAL